MHSKEVITFLLAFTFVMLSVSETLESSQATVSRISEANIAMSNAGHITSTAGLTPHGPIRINKDKDCAVGSFGIVSGAGSKFNPYIIEGWAIDGTGYGYGIYLGNTTHYLVIRNCSVINASGLWQPYFWNTAILLFNAKNVIIENNIISDSYAGIYLNWANSNTVTNNSVKKTTVGVYVMLSDENHIAGNTIDECNYGIQSATAENNTARDNVLKENYWGIFLRTFTNNTDVFENVISKSDSYGIYVTDQSALNRFYRNHFINNNPLWKQAWDDAGTNMWSLASTGNFWSDHTGPDADKNGIVDMPYELDGGKSVHDEYPLATSLYINENGSMLFIILVALMFLIIPCHRRIYSDPKRGWTHRRIMLRSHWQ